MQDAALEAELERRVEALGYELVELERAGSKTRPILRVRIDHAGGSEKGAGVTVDDCSTVSRALEAWLDEAEGVPERYMLEVSSPGIERPLVRARDFQRYAGKEVAVRGKDVLAGRSRRLEGELLGLDERDGREYVRLRLNDGAEVDVARDEITRAHVFRWEDR
jgi:ribosome maturation factor RimP